MAARASRVVPHVLPFRGDQVGAGVVVLTVLVLLVQLRMGWGAGAHLAVAVVAALGVGSLLAGLAPEERPYVASIVTCELVLVALAIGRLADLLTTAASWGTVVWTSAAFGAVCVVLARAHRAATATLAAGLVAVVLPVAVAEWLADPSAGVLRTLLLLSGLGLALGAIATRDRRPTRAAQLANAGGVAIGLIVAGPLLLVVPALLGGDEGFVVLEAGWGWQLCLLAAGGGLVAYGAADRQRGPVIVGALDLLLFCLGAAWGGDLLGWPLVLALAALALLGVGLRPTTPAPAPPGADDDDPPAPLPLPRLEGR